MAQKMFADHINSGMTEITSFSCPSMRPLHAVYVRSPAAPETSSLGGLGELLEIPVGILGIVVMYIS